MYAWCRNKARRNTLVDRDEGLVAGDTTAGTGWLRDNVQQYGGLYKPREVIEKACGFEPSEAPLLEYLEAKFGAIYGV